MVNDIKKIKLNKWNKIKIKRLRNDCRKWNKIWFYCGKLIISILKGSDLPNAFTESSVCGHKGGIEYYRKPNFLPDSNQLTFSSRFRKSTDSEMN